MGGGCYTFLTEELNSAVQLGDIQSRSGWSSHCNKEMGYMDADFSQCGIVAKNRARLSLDRSSALVLSEPGICVAPTLIGYVLL